VQYRDGTEVVVALKGWNLDHRLGRLAGPGRALSYECDEFDRVVRDEGSVADMIVPMDPFDRLVRSEPMMVGTDEDKFLAAEQRANAGLEEVLGLAHQPVGFDELSGLIVQVNERLPHHMR
jgi:hypothetical protein